MIASLIDDSYRVERFIGRGSSGDVYQCVDIQLGRAVAVKILRAEAVGESEINRFLSEGRNLASLNHPNVVQIYRFGTHDERPYLVMELVRGKPLRELLRQGSLPMRRTLELLRQVAEGARAIHSMGILHRDLSPNN